MIEINLLPKANRPAEGPNLSRVIAVAASVLVFTLGAVFLAKYHLFDIPQTNAAIKKEEDEKKLLEIEVKKVEDTKAQIAEIAQRVSGLKNLEYSRIMWSRLLFFFKKSLPADRCVIRRFTVSEDSDPTAEISGGGKRMKMDLSCLTTGNTDRECELVLQNLMNNLKTQFGVKAVVVTDPLNTPAAPAPGAPAPTPAAPAPAAPEDLELKRLTDLGFHPIVKLKFGDPLIRTTRSTKPPEASGLELSEKEQYKMLEHGLDITLTMSFVLPVPAQENTQP